MEFKTAAQIRAEREAAGKASEREERRRQRAAEKSSKKYARMAEESAKREAARKQAGASKLVVDRERVIITPVLMQANLRGEGHFGPKLKTKAERKAEYQQTPKPGARQVWDAATRTWVKRQ